MVRKLSNFSFSARIMLSASWWIQHLTTKSVVAFTILLLSFQMGISQEDDTRPPKVNNYKEDSSFAAFNKYHVSVAKAQIVSLKKGALLVRVKTNANTINRLKAAGNMDLATQVERETALNNKIIMRAYRKEFNFCPVYFFNSDCSDSVKHKNLEGIFLDSNLVVDPAFRCNTSFYLIAEQGTICESSLGLVSESKAPTAIERGSASKEVSIVVKNRYFIQLHKPFPYYQSGYNLKKYGDYVKRFNMLLTDFYTKNSGFVIPSEIMEFVY